MSRADIRLKYGRVGHEYHGVLGVTVDGVLSETDFEGHTFARMLSSVATHVRLHDEATVELSRLELPGSDYLMDAGTVDLLRKDPAAAISAMTHEDRTVVIRDRKSSDPPRGLLRAGHDTVAASFGDNVYMSVSDLGRFECPGCGRWSPVMTHVSAACDGTACRLKIFGNTHGTAWFSTSTELLLSRGLTRYYLPRPWNPSGGWISHEDLRTMFEAFKKEREQCNQLTAPRA